MTADTGVWCCLKTQQQQPCKSLSTSHVCVRQAEQAARVLVEAQRDALAAELAAEQRSAAAARTAAAATAADTRRAVGARLARVETSVHHAMTAVQGAGLSLQWAVAPCGCRLEVLHLCITAFNGQCMTAFNGPCR